MNANDLNPNNSLDEIVDVFDEFLPSYIEELEEELLETLIDDE